MPTVTEERNLVVFGRAINRFVLYTERNLRDTAYGTLIITVQLHDKALWYDITIGMRFKNKT